MAAAGTTHKKAPFAGGVGEGGVCVMKDAMRRSLVLAACAFALAAFHGPLPCSAESLASRSAMAIKAIDERPSGKPDLVRQFGHQRIETYVGAAAREFIRLKRARDPRFAKLMDASAERLATRGYKNRSLETLHLLSDTRRETTVAQRIWEALVPRLSAQDVFGASGDEPINGVGVWSAWDDGDDSTWEGNAYLENYDSGQWYSVDNQLDVSSEMTRLVWADSRDFEARDRHTREGLAPVAFRPRQLSAPSVCSCGRSAEIPASCMLRVALDRSFVRCGIAAGGCLLSGPGYVGCVGTGCGGSITWEFLAEAWRWGRDCSNLFRR
jgi:hypothetical protein